MCGNIRTWRMRKTRSRRSSAKKWLSLSTSTGTVDAWRVSLLLDIGAVVGAVLCVGGQRDCWVECGTRYKRDRELCSCYALFLCVTVSPESVLREREEGRHGGKV